jgi:hypothetical protein
MSATLELAAGAVRLCAVEDGRVTALESWRVPPGGDPLATLTAAPLPRGLGQVRILLHHDDLLVRTLVQPAGPIDRLDKLVRFELENLASGGADGEGQATALAWQSVPADGDHRVLALLVRQRLIDRVRQALAGRAVLAGISHPALGLYHDFHRQEPEHQGTAVLLDVGGRCVHLAVVRHGVLAFIRTQQPGMEELTAQVASLRGIPTPDAATLVARLADGSPEDLKDLVIAQAGTVAAQVTAAVRFARTQLNLDLEPTALYVTGQGALAYGFISALAARSRLPVRLLNPFAGLLSALPSDRLDSLAGLPGPWAPVIGGALATTWELDALADERQAKTRFNRTTGALRWGAAAGIAMALTGAAISEYGAKAARQERAELAARQESAQRLNARLAAAQDRQRQAGDRLAWLAGEHRLASLAAELPAAVAKLQDPSTCPVTLTSFALSRRPGVSTAELTGAATAGRVGADTAIHSLQNGLRQLYPPIADIEVLPTAIEKDRQGFRFVATIPDG